MFSIDLFIFILAFINLFFKSQASKLESLLTETASPTSLPEESLLDAETGEANEEVGEKWVQTMENVCQLIPKGLPFLVAKNGEGE